MSLSDRPVMNGPPPPSIATGALGSVGSSIPDLSLRLDQSNMLTNIPTDRVDPTDQSPESACPDLNIHSSNGIHKRNVKLEHVPDGLAGISADDLANLRRVSGPIPWQAYSIAFVELCERFSYYGTTAVFVNFIQRPLPPGSTTGAAGTHGQPGALGMGQRASTGLTTFNQFWAYVMPLFGAYIADQFWGRYKTIQVAISASLLGHLILVVSALPPVIKSPSSAMAAFTVGLIVTGVGTGGFKSNISPLIAEQSQEKTLMIKTTAKGERVLVDPAVTVSRIFMYFYLCINIGSLVGQVGMVYAEKYVGFWLAFALPTVLFLCAPVVLAVCKKRYVLTPPAGSVLAMATKTIRLAMAGGWSINPVRISRHLNKPGFWDNVKPSRLIASGTPLPDWMTFDDIWIDQLARGLQACKVFLWFPLYWLAYNQMIANLTSQAATMQLGGVPNDIINNLDPISLIIFIPLVDQFLYPGLRKLGIPFTPIKRITAGFGLASLAMLVATLIQYYIYKTGSCHTHMNSCSSPAPISVWVQTPAYVLIGLSEIMASITGLEYAFTKAPENMRSLITALFLFMTAFSSAISQAFVPLAEDPLLVWNYAVVAILAAFGGIGFWFTHRGLDQKEDELNALSNHDAVVDSKEV